MNNTLIVEDRYVWFVIKDIQEVSTRPLLLGGLRLSIRLSPADNELTGLSVIVIERLQTDKTVQQLGVRFSVNCNDQLGTHLLLVSFC